MDDPPGIGGKAKIGDPGLGKGKTVPVTSPGLGEGGGSHLSPTQGGGNSRRR